MRNTDVYVPVIIEDARVITVRACKYDGTLHRIWRAPLARRAQSLIVLDAVFEAEIQHPLLGVIRPGTASREFYWLDRWYNVFRFAEPSGHLRNYYCNINTPPTFDDETLSYIDLDIDILVAPDLSYTVLDEDEFAANAARYAYPHAIRTRAYEALSEVIALIEARQFPFDKDT